MRGIDGHLWPAAGRSRTRGGRLTASTGDAQAAVPLTHAGLYKHTSLGPAEQAVKEMGTRNGFAVTTVEGYKYNADKLDFSFLTRDYLNQFDGIMMMTNGSLPFTVAQKEMLLDFVKSGKGFIGTHCSSLTFYDYPAFGEMLRRLFRAIAGRIRRSGGSWC